MPETDEGFSSDDERQLTKKELQEIERKRAKNKKKKESRKKKGPKVEALPPAAAKEAVKKDETKTEGDAPVAEDGAVKEETEDDIAVEIEYVGETPVLDEEDPNFKYFTSVFGAFSVGGNADQEKFPVSSGKYDEARHETRSKFSMLEADIEEKQEKMSRRKLRLAMQPSIAKLKESTYRPDVVEWADVTSRDPFLLVALKAYRNTVPVPRHWNAKRKYLAGKRGFERQAFQLPDFIRRTGIQDLREAMWEKEEHSSLKSKMRAMARPKLGKIDIDYQKLHDAFFKWQTKPAMTMMGELYYEGKEQEALMRDKKPGSLSDNLRIALGMPVGPNAHKFPPPWLIAMQRYGPPPSYPNIKIPGLSAPIPEGCAFGYHAGGWGKPPVDEYGKPMYGDVFGVEQTSQLEPEDESRIERRFWGEIQSDEDSDVESDEEEEEEPVPEKPAAAAVDGMTTPMVDGLVTPSGITTGITGLETPDTIELRKGKRAETESNAGVETPAAAAYHIIPEKKTDRVGNAMMGSTHVYDLSKKQAVNEHGIEISLDPDAIDLDQSKLQEKYDEQLRKQNKNEDTEDLTDMVAEHTAKQNRKRKAQEQKKSSSSSSSKPEKKYKDFKF